MTITSLGGMMIWGAGAYCLNHYKLTVKLELYEIIKGTQLPTIGFYMIATAI